MARRGRSILVVIDSDEVAGVLAHALGQDGFDAGAGFFREGGDSVRAMLAVGRLMPRAEARGLATPLLEGQLINALFEEGTASAVAAVLAAARETCGRDKPGIRLSSTPRTPETP